MIIKKMRNKYVICLKKGEEIMASLKKIAKNNKLKAGFMIGLGAASKIEIAFFDFKKKKYITKKINHQHEITSFIGNIAKLESGELILHAHVNLTNADFKAIGGHLIAAVVSGTFEGLIIPLTGNLSRRFDSESGLKVLDF